MEMNVFVHTFESCNGNGNDNDNCESDKVASLKPYVEMKSPYIRMHTNTNTKSVLLPSVILVRTICLAFNVTIVYFYSLIYNS